MARVPDSDTVSQCAGSNAWFGPQFGGEYRHGGLLAEVQHWGLVESLQPCYLINLYSASCGCG